MVPPPPGRRAPGVLERPGSTPEREFDEDAATLSDESALSQQTRDSATRVAPVPMQRELLERSRHEPALTAEFGAADAPTRFSQADLRDLRASNIKITLSSKSDVPTLNMKSDARSDGPTINMKSDFLTMRDVPQPWPPAPPPGHSQRSTLSPLTPHPSPQPMLPFLPPRPTPPPSPVAFARWPPATELQDPGLQDPGLQDPGLPIGPPLDLNMGLLPVQAGPVAPKTPRPLRKQGQARRANPWLYPLVVCFAVAGTLAAVAVVMSRSGGLNEGPTTAPARASKRPSPTPPPQKVAPPAPEPLPPREATPGPPPTFAIEPEPPHAKFSKHRSHRRSAKGTTKSNRPHKRANHRAGR